MVFTFNRYGRSRSPEYAHGQPIADFSIIIAPSAVQNIISQTSGKPSI